MQMFLVGGAVRDELLGVPSKDMDYTVVLEEDDVNSGTRHNLTLFEIMTSLLVVKGFKIFLETPEFLTVRAQFPALTEGTSDADPTGKFDGKVYNRLTADFVLARKESAYTDGRRPDTVELGTLEDDLRRRDFTMNAVAKDADGLLIDPFNGVEHIEQRLIVAVGSAQDRLREDALRAVRALRFSVTKGFVISQAVSLAMEDDDVLDAIVNKISDERIDQELSKMFRFDTLKSLAALQAFPLLTRALFSGTVSLDSTMKTKGRGGP